MPTKRKKKATPKGKNAITSENSSGASSESDNSKTLEILNRISQKFMGACDKKNGHRKQPVSEIGYDADEEASTTGTSDMSTQSPAHAEASLYDFDEPDCEMQVLPVPKKGKNAKTKSSTARSKKLLTDKKKHKPAEPAVNKGKKSNKSLKNSDVNPINSKPKVLKKTNKNNQENTPVSIKSQVKTRQGCVSVSNETSDSPSFSKTPVVTLQRLDVSNVEGYESFQRQLRKRKCEAPKDQATPQVKSKVLKATPILKNVTINKHQQRKRDSGVLMSPPSLRKIPAPASTDTSTPSNIVPRGKQKQPDHSLLNESCFGFDTSVSFAAETSLSPVKSKALPPITPLSDYASMDSLQISYDISRRQSVGDDADVPELFSMDQDDLSLNRSMTKSYKTSTKRRPKKVVSTSTSSKPAVSTTSSKTTVSKKSKTDVIAEKFNTEFDEIEKFQLSIEEM
ncbi:uncharacterized protein LOC132555971 [Ylistrum balloti]|uniref:uncharacterized protein LOC132555971 n=1 Tax=Ylistrum balloti TaxID=509963 RepID=UPI002905AD01|nr:uncharacterized protein LOC132555971 [Ylistrum balloti]